ncbi:MAG: serine hydrolase [Acidimicrobiales bacterium]|nr:serine hydrolase [Acidimicrobiales bacterium]
MTAYAILDALAGLTDPPVAMAAAIIDSGEIDEAYDFAQETSCFEFNSIGKTMTAQVLATFVVDGVVSLDDAIGAWLDAGSNGDITLRQLATHTSGLPRMAANASEGDGFDPANPYAVYGPELAEAALRDAPRGDAGYSNFGLQLLGLALERIGGASFNEPLRRHVFEPFGLADATVAPGPGQVQGYRLGQPTAAWTDLLAGPGGVNGTLRDLVAWAKAVLDPSPAMRFAVDNDLGWARAEPGLIWHNGGSYGFHSTLVVDPAARRAAMTLIATSDLEHVDQATFLACVGLDPMDARPATVGDAFNAPAMQVTEMLVGNRWDEVRARMTERCAEVLTAELLADAWVEVMGPLGEFRSATVTRALATRGAVVVQLDLTFTDGTGEAEVNFDPDGKVTGLRIA